VTTSRIRTDVEGRRASLPVTAAPAGVVVLDGDQRIVAVHAARRLGRIGPEHVGEPLAATYPELHRAVAAAAARVLATGLPEVGIEIPTAAGATTANLYPAAGGSRPTVSCVLTGAPAPPPAGVAAVVDSDADAIVSADLGGIIRSWNAGAERLYGYGEKEAMGQPISLLEPPARRQRFGELVGALMGCSRAPSAEVVRWRKDGSRVEVWLTRVDVHNGAGRVVGITEIGRDVTGRCREARRAARALRESERLRCEVVASMLQAEEVERSRIATELHDDTVQVMIASLMAMDRVALVAQRTGSPGLQSAVAVARATLEEATDRTRRLMFELRPAVLTRDGLVAAVRVLAQQVARETGASARVRGALGRYDHALEELVYRSVQEALANVRKHARAEAITVTLRELGGAIRAEVCDDGLGFDVVDARTRRGAALHLGLDALYERVRAVGGTASVTSSPGQGTCVRFAVPLTAATREAVAAREAAMLER
jgi:PAS domain S-box-containing protein